ncbi:ferredoxin [uncultured Olegusella sp.]|uniref:ferredoxin n=1 Tax=uncultured Olegusella sp. TaxID=1979846 RepID=UPI002615B10B|nr:ferredoxin [uncultured Olegusella sp.]
MKASVSEECIGCGMCEGICPDVFEVGDDGLAHVIVDEVSADVEDDAKQAAEDCPVEAITIE